MADENDMGSLERLLRPLRRELTPELARTLLRVRADDELQTRYDELADKHTAGTLTREEHGELASLVRANSLLGVLKAEAHAFLHRPQAA